MYAHYIEIESEIEGLNDWNEIDSKNILFSHSMKIKEKLISVLNYYYYRKNFQVNINPYYLPFIKIMYCGRRGSGKSILINEFNGEKIAYSSGYIHNKTKEFYLYKNKNYPILNLETVDEKYYLGEKPHILIYLLENERGIVENDILKLLKFHQMRILYYILYPKKKGLDKYLRRKANIIISDEIKKLKNNDKETQRLFKDFQDKDNLKKILQEMNDKLKERIFSANILSRKSNDEINLFLQIKKDLFNVYNIHKNYIEIEKISEKTEEQNLGNYEKVILDDSPFFYKYSIDDIKRKEAEICLEDFNVSIFWLYRKEILEQIKNIYSDVTIDAKINEAIFFNKKSWFYTTKNSKEFINKLIDIFAEKYKKLELKKKYHPLCKKYNKSIELFEKYVEKFSNLKLNKKPVNFDIDFI